MMYRGVFTVGIAVTHTSLTLADALIDYSYVNARSGDPNGVFVARCLTGMGPTSTSNVANGELGGWFFKGTKISINTACFSTIIQPVPGSSGAGVINLYQCGSFTTDNEGVYTCTTMNSAMMNESIKLGIYFNRRSELLNLYISSFNYLSSLCTAAPVIDTPSSSTITVNVGDFLTLSCISQGSPPDTFTWRKDNDPTVLQSTSITAVDHTSTSAVFRADYYIDSVTTSDSGTYTCNVTNPIGSDSATIMAVVTSKLLIWSMTLQ